MTKLEVQDKEAFSDAVFHFFVGLVSGFCVFMVFMTIVPQGNAPIKPQMLGDKTIPNSEFDYFCQQLH